MLPSGFFVTCPQEFSASISNEWFADSAKTIRLGLSRFDAGRVHPINQALHFADVYSQGGNSTCFYVVDDAGTVTRTDAALHRDTQGRIDAVQLEEGWYQFTLDTEGRVTSYSRPIPLTAPCVVSLNSLTKLPLTALADISSISPADLEVTALPDGTAVAGVTFAYDVGSRLATFSLPQNLPTGAYRIHLPAGAVLDEAGQPLPEVEYKFIQINGSTGDDAFLVRRDSTNTVVERRVGGTLQDTTQLAVADLDTIVLRGVGGSDTFTIDRTTGNPMPVSGELFFDGGSGSAWITALGPTAPGLLRVAQGSFLLDSDLAGLDYHVDDATYCAVFTSQHLEGLFLGKGSRMDLVPGRNVLLRTNALTLDGARLDLAGESNHVVINNGIVQRDVLEVYLRAGRQPDWRANTHSGIASLFNTDPAGLPILRSFAGEAVAAGDVLLGVREFGDLNLDRRIDIDDYFAIWRPVTLSPPQLKVEAAAGSSDISRPASLTPVSPPFPTRRDAP